MTPEEKAEYAEAKYVDECAAIMARADISLPERVRLRGERAGAWVRFCYRDIEPGPLVLPDAPPFEPWNPSHREIL